MTDITAFPTIHQVVMNDGGPLRTFTFTEAASAGQAVGTANLGNGAIINGRGNNVERTWGTVNMDKGSAVINDSTIVTIDELNEPSGPHTLSVA